MQSVAVRYEGEATANLSLRGSYAAMKVVIDCQVNMSRNLGLAGGDPFVSSSGLDSDPFN